MYQLHVYPSSGLGVTVVNRRVRRHAVLSACRPCIGAEGLVPSKQENHDSYNENCHKQQSLTRFQVNMMKNMTVFKHLKDDRL